ncbi:MAG: hypothetical protein M0P69_06045 [Bacteroidales bacterium]|nr:hypothetical protein [Bacteroidales bacterium]
MEAVTKTQFSKTIGVSKARLTAMLKEGLIPPECLVGEGRHAKIDPEKAANFLKKRLDPSREPKSDLSSFGKSIQPVDTGNGDYGARFTKARAIKEELLAVKIQLEINALEDQINRRIEKIAFEKARSVRDAILMIPDRVSDLLAAETDALKVSALLTNELIQSLEDLC